MYNDALTEVSTLLNLQEIASENIDVHLIQHIFKIAYDFGNKDGCNGIYVCPSSSFSLINECKVAYK